MAKILYYDLETTGLDSGGCAIHQLAAIYEVDGEISTTLNYRISPFEGANVDAKALEVGGVTEEQIRAYPSEKETYRKLKNRLTQWVDRFDKADKIHLCGFNNRAFDDMFFRAFFERQDDPFFNAYFFSGTLDVSAMAATHLLSRRASMQNFKLATVAKTLGVEVSEKKLHDAFYDVVLTYKSYKAIMGEEASDLFG